MLTHKTWNAKSENHRSSIHNRVEHFYTILKGYAIVLGIKHAHTAALHHMHAVRAYLIVKRRRPEKARLFDQVAQYRATNTRTAS